MPWLSTLSDLADRESGIDARNIGAGRSEGADQAGARIRRAADDLHQLAVAGIHGKHLQLIRIGVPLSCQNPGDHEGLEARFIVNGLHFETDGGQPLDDFVKRRVGLQMVLQPGEGEFHVRVPVAPTSASDGPSTGRAPFAAAAYSPSGSTSRDSFADQFHVGRVPAVALEIPLMPFAPVGQSTKSFAFIVGEGFIDVIETPDDDLDGFNDRRSATLAVEHDIAPPDDRFVRATVRKISQRAASRGLYASQNQRQKFIRHLRAIAEGEGDGGSFHHGLSPPNSVGMSSGRKP